MEEQSFGVTPSGSGSQASPEAADASSPSVSIPDAGHLFKPSFMPKGATWEPRPGFCRHAVHEGGRGVGFHQCFKRAKVTRTVDHGGKVIEAEYCAVHDPVAVKAKADKWRADYEAKRERESARYREMARQKALSDAAIAALKQIAAGHNDPRTLALKLLAEHGEPLTPPEPRIDPLLKGERG